MNRRIRCWQCQSDCFFVNSDYNICEECGVSNGHALGFFDQKDYDRLHFRKKSIYQRKYHYEKKIDQVSKRLHLMTEDQKYCLYNKLMAIDNPVMKILNKQFCRKRMISIFYLIKKFLEEMGNKKYKLVYLKISGQTLENYEKWWNSYKSIHKYYKTKSGSGIFYFNNPQELLKRLELLGGSLTAGNNGALSDYIQIAHRLRDIGVVTNNQLNKLLKKYIRI